MPAKTGRRFHSDCERQFRRNSFHRILDMASNGNGGSTSNTIAFRLRTVSNVREFDKPVRDQLSVDDIALARNDHAQTISFCTSVEALNRRVESMQSKGFDIAAIAGHEGKFITAFTKVETAIEVALMNVETADPGISHSYRLSTSTLQHVAHNGQSWMFTYLAEKQTAPQTIIKCQTLEAMLAQIKAIWKRNYRVTSLTYGAGHWVAVATQSFDPDEQSYFTAPDTESLQEKTKKAWDEGRKIAAITYGADRWLVILNRESDNKSQKWLSRKTFVDLRAKIREEWTRGFQVTSLAHGADVWLAVLTRS